MSDEPAGGIAAPDLVHVGDLEVQAGGGGSEPRLQGRIDPALIYVRTAPRFETGAAGDACLGRHIFLGTGIRRPDRVEIRVFQVM